VQLSIVERDLLNNPRNVNTAGATAVISVTGANSPDPITATANGDGTYSASYTPTHSGTDNITVQINGVNVGAGTFNLNVNPGAAAQLFIATQPATATPSGSTLPRVPVIQLRDTFGNDVPSAGFSIEVTVDGEVSLGGPTTVVTNSAGSATFSGLSIGGSAGLRHLTFTTSFGTPFSIQSDPVNVTSGAVAAMRFDVE